MRHSPEMERFLALANTYSPFSLQEEIRYGRLKNEGDPSAREKLVLHNLLFVAHYINRHCRWLEFDEALQEGVIGLIRAVDKYDPSRGVRVVTFADQNIRAQLQRYTKKIHAIRLPSTYHPLRRNIQRFIDDCVETKGYHPTSREVCEGMIVSGDVKRGSFEYFHPYLVIDAAALHSLDSRSHSEGGLHELLADSTAETPQDHVLAQERMERMQSVWAYLNDKERSVLRAWFSSNGVSLRTVAATLGLSYERVRLIKGEALAKAGRFMRRNGYQHLL